MATQRPGDGIQERLQHQRARSWPLDYPPMQDPASFNLEAVKKQIDEMIKAHGGQ